MQSSVSCITRTKLPTARLPILESGQRGGAPFGAVVAAVEAIVYVPQLQLEKKNRKSDPSTYPSSRCRPTYVEQEPISSSQRYYPQVLLTPSSQAWSDVPSVSIQFSAGGHESDLASVTMIPRILNRDHHSVPPWGSQKSLTLNWQSSAVAKTADSAANVLPPLNTRTLSIHSRQREL